MLFFMVNSRLIRQCLSFHTVDQSTIRSYYPDFLAKKEDETYVIVEVKGDDTIEAPVVLAKQEFAEQIAIASGMTYKIIRGSEAARGSYVFLIDNGQKRYQLKQSSYTF